VAVSGFPYERKRVRERFPEVLEETGWRAEEADLRLLCIHHCVEGATVGPSDYTFRNAPDVIRCSDLPPEFAAVLSGHIHRHQVLQHDLKGDPIPTPVLYPGSVDRTAFAEKDEEKGYMILDVRPGGSGGRLAGFEFVGLPTRPMILKDLHPSAEEITCWSPEDLETQLISTVAWAPRDAVLRIRIHGEVPSEIMGRLGANRLRGLAPSEMNLEVRAMADAGRLSPRGSRPRRTDRQSGVGGGPDAGSGPGAGRGPDAGSEPGAGSATQFALDLA
jgi:DNA repair exonuclease SbcCD nuclease subunit